MTRVGVGRAGCDALVAIFIGNDMFFGRCCVSFVFLAVKVICGSENCLRQFYYRRVIFTEGKVNFEPLRGGFDT